MAEIAERAATYEDLLAVPEHLVAEILFGRLVTHPRPRRGMLLPAVRSRACLGHHFNLDAADPADGSSWSSPSFILGGTWRCRTWLLGGASICPIFPRLPGSTRRQIGYARSCRLPRSATTGVTSGTIYADAGVGHLWHVDPGLRMLEVFELREGKWLLLGCVP